MIDQLARHGAFLLKQEDTLKVSVPNVSSELENAKRHVLRIVASIFDPLELVSLIFITGKELPQTLWSRGYQWVDVIDAKWPPLVSA